MKRARLTTTLLVAGALWSCGGDTSGPVTLETTAQVTDPMGDTYGSGVVHWDLTAMTITRDADGITLMLDFSNSVTSPTSGDTTAVIGYVGFDVDQDSTTADLASIVDEFRPDAAGSTGLGVDYELELVDYAQDSTVTVTGSAGTTGRVKPVFSGNRVTVRIPKALLGNDDGFLNAAAIVGNNHSPNDIIPEHGHLKLGGTGTVAAYRLQVSALRIREEWGSRR
jgi:hypothetical protein